MSSTSNFIIILFLTLTLIVGISQAWENEEYEMFDLVEEVGQNFYDVLEVPQDANSKDLRQAYRRLSLKLHPDKNPAPDAGEKFRQLVGIYEVLKNPNLRVSYNEVLRDGLPTWRHPSYYYRRVRKLELWQVALIVLSVVSVCQYFGKYASYFEKKLALQEQIDIKLRRTQRTRKSAKEGMTEKELKAEAEKMLTKPSIFDLAPFQIYRGIKYCIFSLPGDLKTGIKEWQEAKEKERIRIAKELEEAEREREIAEEPKKPRKRKVVNLPEKGENDDEDAPTPEWGNKRNQSNEEQRKPAPPPPVSGGLWTDDDISELVRLCSKFPGGTPERWDKIASALNRPVTEVTFVAKRVLEKLSNKKTEDDENVVTQPKIKVKTKGTPATENIETDKVENWSADEQKALENALVTYPKGCSERWDKIARAVRGRSKEECMQRFKYLADILRKSKEDKKKAEEEKEQEEAVVEEVVEPEISEANHVVEDSENSDDYDSDEDEDESDDQH